MKILSYMISGLLQNENFAAAPCFFLSYEYYSTVTVPSSATVMLMPSCT